ncbi:MAG: folate-binding protein YgfZ [Pseudomonadota bacterium]
MNPDWQAFLRSRGADTSEGAARFAPGELGDCNLFDLSHLGLIRVTGTDAESFLQGQFTNDTKALTDDHSQMSAYCSPKGRMLASFRLFRHDGDIHLQLPFDRLATVMQRLGMFRLRSEVTIEDAGDSLVQFAVAGDCAAALLGELAPPRADEVRHSDGITCVALGGDRPRFLCVGPVEAATALWETLAEDATPANSDAWTLLEIRAGAPAVYEQTVEAFVPQMANLQLVNGVSFTKGCYTGQEVVARMQYLGKLKRRMYHVRFDGECFAPGTELFAPGSASGQGSGRLVVSAPAPEGGCEALAVVEIASADQGEVHLGDPAGPMLEFLELPYSFEEPKG